MPYEEYKHGGVAVMEDPEPPLDPPADPPHPPQLPPDTEPPPAN